MNTQLMIFKFSSSQEHINGEQELNFFFHHKRAEGDFVSDALDFTSTH